MRFMVMVKASKNSEAGKMPSAELLAEMGKFNEKLNKAGIMLAGDGLQPSSKGARVRFSKGQRTVTDGRVEEPSPVEIECTNTASRVAPASRIAKERINTVSRIIMPVMLFSSASKPIAVLPPPVVLFTSASSPRKVFALAVS